MFDLNNKLLIAIQPRWTHKIITGQKSIEVRKTIPKKFNRPFDMLMYCTKDMTYPLTWSAGKIMRALTVNKPEYNFNGRIIGECLVTDIVEFRWDENTNRYDISDNDLKATCLTQEELIAYGSKQTLYGYVLSSVNVYKETIPLDKAFRYNNVEHKVAFRSAPQSWGYLGGIEI